MRGQGQWTSQYVHSPARPVHWLCSPSHCWHLAAGTKRTSEDAASLVASGASLESSSSLEDIDSSSLDNAKKESLELARGTPLELAA